MKYVGSKNRIAKYIVPIIQSKIDELGDKCNGYFEPFVSGANVIDKIRCSHKHGYDSNQYLIVLLRYVRDHNEEKYHGPIGPMAWDEVVYFGEYLIENFGYTLDMLKEQWPVLFE